MTNKNLKSQDHHVNYTLNKSKAIKQKTEAADRIYTVTPQFTKGNLVLIFSAASYEELKYITINTLQTQDANIKSVETKNTNGAVISESYTIYENNEKLFVLNFYNSTSKVLLNGKQQHVLSFTKSYLVNILERLDRNVNFTSINTMIRNSCKQYLDMENSKVQKAESQHTPQQKEIGSKRNISSNMANNPSIKNYTLPTCPISNERCTNKCKAVGCDTCDQWLHYDCEALSPEKIKIIEENGDDNYICKACKIQITALNE
ncbi:unnamed protein product [Mytilus coruscus]|uniref:PHD-type domain-containing protein n=1 Tax=Mytilus coruscus TaxID=42192 RepID=A0A6J8D137_MYTCO|nr:unnamed protein product [Mytilus coruscus]